MGAHEHSKGLYFVLYPNANPKQKDKGLIEDYDQMTTMDECAKYKKLKHLL